MKKRLIVSLLIMSMLTGLPAVAFAAISTQEADKYLSGINSSFDGIADTAVMKKIQDGEKIFLLDVREVQEFTAGHIQGAVNIPLRTLAKNLKPIPQDGTLIVVYCKKGVRGAYATAVLKLLGYTNVLNMSNGFAQWQMDNLPIVK